MPPALDLGEADPLVTGPLAVGLRVAPDEPGAPPLSIVLRGLGCPSWAGTTFEATTVRMEMTTTEAEDLVRLLMWVISKARCQVRRPQR